MSTLEIELLIGPTTFPTLFQVLRIPTSFNLLLGRPWIHRAGVIPFSLHQKVKFIHDGQVITMQSMEDMFISFELVLHMSHSDDDLFLTGFTFDEVQTLKMEDFCRDFVAMSFDQHGITVVLDMIRSMSYLLGMGLGRRQHGPNEFMAILDHDVPFRPGFIPIEVDYRYMARLHKERVRARLTHTPFDYPVHPYTMSLVDYFVRTLELQSHPDGIIWELNIIQEVELQCLIHQLQLSDGAPSTSASTLVVPSSLDRVSLMTLYFPDEFDGIVQPKLASPFDLFGVSTIEVADEVQTAPTSKFSDDVIFVDDLLDDPMMIHLLSYAGPIDHRVSPATGDTKVVDVGTANQPRKLKIGDMSGLDPSIVQHRLPLLPHARPVKHKLRRLHPRWSLQVKEEIQKELSVGILSAIGKVNPKDDFPLPHIDMLVDSTIGHPMLSFMDRFFGYSQILMAPEDMEKTSFITEWGTYCYKVMSFGLKNALATYQRVVITLFHDMMHRDIEVYVDDMIM
ncbi:Transposon Ty3-I Gag-Pol polyprotein [Vitis vinifera]|uniref:Transposon Ty3-I Gag-Pol polyprotein n=1 Tax=Vitis vinifera TaxID=29760 RepID=A0A438H1W3_VITVI|nr:Transposon Ty3-I Gag-Pol polyprotein [Vitis vinifera]